jgi:hypothetical protein
VAIDAYTAECQSWLAVVMRDAVSIQREIAARMLRRIVDQQQVRKANRSGR